MSNQNQQNQNEREKEKQGHNFKENPDRAREAGRKGGEQSQGGRE